MDATYGHSNLARRAVLAATAVLALAGSAKAQKPAVKLFKIVGPRDEIIVGVTVAVAEADAGALAKRLVADGQITVWKYVVGRDGAGNLTHVAQAKIAILRNDTLRIEPYVPALPVAPPP